MAPADLEGGRCHSATDIAKQGCPQDNQRKRRVEREDGDERSGGNRPQNVVLECARADTMRRLHHDGGDGGLDAVEQPGDQRNVAEGHVQPGQPNQHEQRGQHEQRTGDDASPAAVHQPADIGCQLLRLRAGQHHAVIEGVQETFFADPAAAFDQFAVHDRNLAGRAAEADEAEFEPEAEGFPEADGRWRQGGGWRVRGAAGHGVLSVGRSSCRRHSRSRRPRSGAWRRRGVGGRRLSTWMLTRLACSGQKASRRLRLTAGVFRGGR